MDDRHYGTIPGRGRRNGMPPGGGYVYRGTGEDLLTSPDVMREWNRQLRARGANPWADNKQDLARLAQVENELALERSRIPARPTTPPAPRVHAPVDYWPAYYPGPGVPGRCSDCGYMLTARGHEVCCG